MSVGVHSCSVWTGNSADSEEDMRLVLSSNAALSELVCIF